VLHPLYAKGEWKGQGRQGLLNQVHYDISGKPVADYPINSSFAAPHLPSSGIPWMVPHSDFFNSDTLNPEWSFLGYTAADKWSLTDRPGWLDLTPKNSSKANTVIKNDGEHNYSLITRLDFNPSSTSDEAGLWIMRGDQTMAVKLVSTLSSTGDNAIRFSFDTAKYEVKNNFGDTLWLKMVRINHKISGYFSDDGNEWTQVGKAFDISVIDSYSDYSTFTGTRQGLYVNGVQSCWFDLYIYRDAYTPVLAECPANQLGTKRLTLPRSDTTVLDNIYYNNWAMYAGVEFGNNDYHKKADSIKIIASSATDGGTVEVYIDLIDASTKIAECNISGTGSWNTFKTFSAKLLSSVKGNHDIYLLFTGSVVNKLFMLQSFYFTGTLTTTGVKNLQGYNIPGKFDLDQNFPNPFNPSTNIDFTLPVSGKVILTVYNQLGQQVATVADGEYSAGTHQLNFYADNLASGVYYYRIKAGSYIQAKKMILMK
jgi:xylan 1,4-beta-xylosidase